MFSIELSRKLIDLVRGVIKSIMWRYKGKL